MSNQPPRDNKDLQGEGNYDATRRYDQAAHEFAQSGQVDPAARAAQPTDAVQAADMKRAEEIGRAHSKGEDASSDAAKAAGAKRTAKTKKPANP